MNEEIVLLKIHKALQDDKDHYEATRKNWKISLRRTESIQYAVGINRGKVECVYQPLKWHVIEDGVDKGRLYFEGSESSAEIILKLQYAEEHLLKKFGSGNPIAYISLSELESYF